MRSFIRYASGHNLTVSQQSMGQLSDTTVTIISNFQNWDDVRFVQNGQALGAPRERPFFLGSRVSGDIREVICFYYVP
jgi:hypothetical protein